MTAAALPAHAELRAQLAQRRNDAAFMARLRERVEQDAPILDRLAEDDDYDDDGADLDPCNYCPHDNTRHRGDGCLDCGCVAAQ